MTSKTSGGPDRGPDRRPEPRHRNPRHVAWVGVGLAALLTAGLVTLATQRARQATGRPAAGRGATGAAGQPGGAVGPVGPAVQVQVSGPAGATVGRAAPTVAVRTLSGQTFRLPAGGQPIGPPGYQVAQDQGGKLAAAFAVRALDTTVVVNPAGRVVWRDAVPTDTATLQAALRTAGLAR